MAAIDNFKTAMDLVAAAAAAEDHSAGLVQIRVARAYLSQIPDTQLADANLNFDGIRRDLDLQKADFERALHSSRGFQTRRIKTVAVTDP